MQGRAQGYNADANKSILAKIDNDIAQLHMDRE